MDAGVQKMINKAALPEAQAEREARLCELKDTEHGDEVWPRILTSGQLTFSKPPSPPLTLRASEDGARDRKREREKKVVAAFVFGMATSIREEST